MQVNLDHIKTAANVVVRVGTGKIVYAIINNNVEPSKATDKVAIASASFVLGGMIAEQTTEYTHRLVNETAETVTKIKTAFKKD